ncbi:MAG TPA: serine hydrolase [Oligoflexus sp.]|uniref:serine hydrolase n=1 Tax=Oligoflexus sp. TaxID=1971216 RepID=UPI002D69F59B|nr:serine hydrolase [Oligoflexus sp.]HYX34172.1 serine hydrolase [Oligoflexus sp.]
MIVKVLRNGFLYLILASCATAAEKALPQPPPNPSGVSTSDSALSEQLTWFLKALNERQGKITLEEINAHFHSSFLAALPADKLSATFQQFAAQLGLLTLKSTDPVVAPAPGMKTMIAHVTANSGNFRIVLTIEEASGTITGLFVQPESPPAKVPVTWAEADQMILALAPQAEILVAEFNQGTCRPIHELRPSALLAIGSTFKLYVLQALVERIREGKLSWDDTIAIRDEWKSLPSGTMQDEPAGKTFTVQKFAEQMISISDNTATDHLIHTIGRDRVEAALRRSGHHNPDLNIPFLSTRELFLLKLKAGTAEAYLSKSPSDRRKYLEDVLAPMPLNLSPAELGQWTQPKHIDSLEWFAKGEDLCRVLGTFVKASEKNNPSTQPAMAILSKNPGLPIDAQKFPFIGFKGGSEPGVMNLSWLLQRDDKRWFVVSVSANDKAKPLKESDLLGVATGVLQQVSTIR